MHYRFSDLKQRTSLFLTVLKQTVWQEHWARRNFLWRAAVWKYTKRECITLGNVTLELQKKVTKIWYSVEGECNGNREECSVSACYRPTVYRIWIFRQVYLLLYNIIQYYTKNNSTRRRIYHALTDSLIINRSPFILTCQTDKLREWIITLRSLRIILMFRPRSRAGDNLGFESHGFEDAMHFVNCRARDAYKSLVNTRQRRIFHKRRRASPCLHIPHFPLTQYIIITPVIFGVACLDENVMRERERDFRRARYRKATCNGS